MTQLDRLPLFPLQLVLFPEQSLPLHIFEPRYRDLLAYCLETEEPFGVLLNTEGRMANVGCTARIERIVQRYDDGRSDILTYGETRFVVDEFLQETSYLTAHARPLRDAIFTAPPQLRQRAIALHLKLSEYLGEKQRPTAYEENRFLSFYLAQRCGLPIEQQQEILESTSEESRLEAIVTHLGELLPQLQRAVDEREKIRSDGHLGAPPEV